MLRISSPTLNLMPENGDEVEAQLNEQPAIENSSGEIVAVLAGDDGYTNIIEFLVEPGILRRVFFTAHPDNLSATRLELSELPADRAGEDYPVNITCNGLRVVFSPSRGRAYVIAAEQEIADITSIDPPLLIFAQKDFSERSQG